MTPQAARRKLHLATIAWVLVALAASLLTAGLVWTFAPAGVAVVMSVGAAILVGALTFAEVEQAHDALIDAVLEDGAK